MKPNKEGYWLVKTSLSLLIVEISYCNMFNMLIGIPGRTLMTLSSFEREYNVSKWIKHLDIEELYENINKRNNKQI